MPYHLNATEDGMNRQNFIQVLIIQSLVLALVSLFDVFFPLCQGFGENVRPFIPCLHFFSFFEVEISSYTVIPSLCQDQSTVAQQAEMIVAKCSLTSCVRTHFKKQSLNDLPKTVSEKTPTSKSRLRPKNSQLDAH